MQFQARKTFQAALLYSSATSPQLTDLQRHEFLWAIFKEEL